MAGSEAEERIRAKAEAMLRAVFPDARIIHELVLAQGGVRIDLAAVTVDRLICVEIKSERDVLTRLPDQIAAMQRVADAWRVYVADKHLEKARELAKRENGSAAWLGIVPESAFDKEGGASRDVWVDTLAGLCLAPYRLEMLWADELRRIRCPSRNAPRRSCVAAATDSLTGAQVRRAVCAALRARQFPRADPPIEWSET